MNDHITTKAIILKSSNLGEYDRRLVILTADYGKITVFARGARRQGSRHLASCSPFSYGTLRAFPGRNAYSLVDFSAENYFEGLRLDFEISCLGMYFLEIADYYARENSDDVELMRLLYVALCALERIAKGEQVKISPVKSEVPARAGSAADRVDGGDAARDGDFYRGDGKKLSTVFSSPELIRYAFELKAIAVNGEFEGPSALPRCSPGLSSALEHIARCKVKDTLAFSVSEEVGRELAQAADFFFSRHIHGEFKSLELLKM